MMRWPSLRESAALALLALLPVLACAPAWWHERLVTPGDGVFLHYPLRWAVWEAYRQGEVPDWNSAIFSGTGLLAAYRPGALYPPAIVLAILPPFVAFQILVLASLSAAGVLTFVYLRQLGAETVGAYFAGLSFALGSYMVNHLGDAATVIAAPPLLLVLIAAEAYLRRMTAKRAAALAGSVALLSLAGSPEALRAGVGLAIARVLVAHFSARGAPSLWRRLWPVGAGLLLAAPQLVPSLVALQAAGRQIVGLADPELRGPTGAAGMVLRYVSHTPAPALAAAALPLLLASGQVRVLVVLLVACVLLQWGRGPLNAPGTLALAADLALAVLAGLSLSAQWRSRLEREGARLRGYYVAAALVCVAVLPLSAAIAGPLPAPLAGGVGLLALAVILYASLAADRRRVIAGLWLVPLSVAFVLQPQGRSLWLRVADRSDVAGQNVTQAEIRALMGAERGGRVLTLTREWPREAVDLAFGNLAIPSGLFSANGYDPMVPLRSRWMIEGLNSGGVLTSREFLRTDPGRLALLGVRWVQVPTQALAREGDAGEGIDTFVRHGVRRFFAFPVVPATEVRLVSALSDSVAVPQGATVAEVTVHLASGRRFVIPMRAGEETAEWAHERPDVRGAVQHGLAPVAESWSVAKEGFTGHRYRARLALPGRYLVNGVSIEMAEGSGELLVSHLSLHDDLGRHALTASLVSAYMSDGARFRLVGTLPAVRLFAVRGALGHARVVGELRALPTEERVRQALRYPAQNLDSRRQALAWAGDVPAAEVGDEGRPGAARVVRRALASLSIEAEGPGWLVIAEGWDGGWTARMDGRPVPVWRVNQAQLGVKLPTGGHSVTLQHRTRGLGAGVLLAALGLLAVGATWLRERLAERHPGS